MTATLALPEVRWLEIARRYIGLKEISGPKHNSTIVKWWNGLFKDDETPWCGAYVAGVMRSANLPVVAGFAGARNWLNHGTELDRPAYGCLVIFWRGTKTGWSGHVGFVVGVDQKGNLMVLGGNQSDMVRISPFSRDRVLGYRWPSGLKPYEGRYDLPVLRSDGKLSTNEA